MKTLFFIVTFACLLFFKNSFAQRITYKDLIGYWYNADKSKREFSIEFKDNSRLIIRDSIYGISNGTYQLKTDGGQNLLVITLNKKGINHYDQYTLTFVNADTLKFENIDTTDPIGQKLPFPSNIFFMKKKSLK
jgi:hypothetical protein